MPLYEYKCDSCGATFEVIQRFSDPAIETCRVCGGPVHKVISAPAIQFKGSGWYVTDYAKKGTAAAGSAADTHAASADSGGKSGDSSAKTTPTPAGDGAKK